MSSNNDPVRRVTKVWAFACIEAIETGAFDAWLHRIRGAAVTRANTPEYQDTLRAGQQRRGYDGAPNDMYGDDVDG